MSDYESNDSEPGSEYSDSEGEQEGYETDETEKLIESDLKTSVLTFKSLTREKLYLLGEFYNNRLDPILFYPQINEINKKLDMIELYNHDFEESLINAEFELNAQIETLLKKPKESMTRVELQNLQKISSELEKLYSLHDSSENNNPLASLVDQYDSSGVTVNWGFFEEAEKKQMINLAKRLGIKIPQKKRNSNLIEYENDMNLFYKKMINLLPGYLEKLNPTSSSKPEYLLVDKLPLKYSYDTDKKVPRLIEETFHYDILKKELSSLSRDSLMDCIENAGVVGGRVYIPEIKKDPENPS
jgi:hypothetical protein